MESNFDYCFENVVGVQITDYDVRCCFEIQKSSLLEAWSESLFLQTLNEPRTKFYIIRDLSKMKICGFAIWSVVCDEAELLQLCIVKEKRGQGLGKFLLKKALESLKADGFVHFLLEVRSSNIRAIKLYQDNGFNTDCVRKGYYKAHGERGVEDAYLMSRHIEL